MSSTGAETCTEPVLVHADVDERAERRDVGDHALEHHARLAGRAIVSTPSVNVRRRELRARIASGLLELARGCPSPSARRTCSSAKSLGSSVAQHRRVADQLAHVASGPLRRCARRPGRPPGGPPERRADRRRRGCAGSPAHCSNAFAPRRGTSSSCAAVAERRRCASRHATMFAGQPVAEPGDPRAAAAPTPCSRRRRRRSRSPRRRRPAPSRACTWVDVVLVLADADRLRVDLHQLGQRVLQPARDGDRAAQRHVEVRASPARRARTPSTPTRPPRTPRPSSARARDAARSARPRACRSRGTRCRCRSRSAPRRASRTSAPASRSDPSQSGRGSCG